MTTITIERDLLEQARESGMERVVKLHSDGTRTVELPHPDLLIRFAALVAAAEREECAKLCDEAHELMNSSFQGAAAAIRARENV